jgi:F-type H+-transporting ATPase subunit delta
VCVFVRGVSLVETSCFLVMLRRALSSTVRQVRSPAVRFHTARAVYADEAPKKTDNTQLKLNFFIPSQTISAGEIVESVTVPGTEGKFGVLPQHAPTIAELAPGVVSITQQGNVSDYFIAGGFAFVHPDSVLEIAAVEAVELDQLDPEKVKQAISDAERAASSASTEVEKAEAQIALEVANAMSSALSGRA